MKVLSHEEIMELEGGKWKPISRGEVEAAVDADSRVQRYEKSRKYYQSELDECQFLSLIWHKINDSRLLTPENESRMVQDAAERMIERHTFQSLSRDQGFPLNQHKPKWFCKCCEIDSDFDYNRFGTIWLVIAGDNEKYKALPSAKYYTHDGCHRSLVLAKRLLKEKIKYQPVKAILINPRPKKKD